MEQICAVKRDDELMEVAHYRAMSRLDEIQERFCSGLRPGECLYVKKGFEGLEGRREFMWLEVLAWKGDTVVARLSNQPLWCPTLRPGQLLSLQRSEIFDWCIEHEDGTTVGGITTKAALQGEVLIANEKG